MYEFHTPEPIRLRLEFGSGDISVEAVDTDRTVVEVSSVRDDDAGREAVADTRVEQRDGDVVIEAPRRSGFFGREPGLRLRVRLPRRSNLDAKIDSADLVATGQLGAVNIKTGSGDVRLDTVLEEISVQAGSGDVEIERAFGSTRVKSGSGDIRIRAAEGGITALTGSGDIDIDHADAGVQADSGSGDVRIAVAQGDLTLRTASGDQSVSRITTGRLRSTSASGDVHVGVAAGTAAWLNVNSLTGSVHTELDGAEPPEAGEDAAEVHINSVTGAITLVRA